MLTSNSKLPDSSQLASVEQQLDPPKLADLAAQQLASTSSVRSQLTVIARGKNPAPDLDRLSRRGADVANAETNAEAQL
jgi:hypothetical protein